tara:strand:+ start:613 stop:819 length:207 start_codon:yes stop_codon:yes gene_type:complete
MKELSTYLGSDNYSDRTAKVLWDESNKEYFVDMRKDGYSELRSMSRHSERYAEDCAENFVMGWGEFNR